MSTGRGESRRPESGIAFQGDGRGRRARIVGTGLDVWEVIQMAQEFSSDAALIADTQLTEQHLRLARAYYAEFPDEIDAAIAENTRTVDEWRALFPFVISE